MDLKPVDKNVSEYGNPAPCGFDKMCACGFRRINHKSALFLKCW